MAASCAYAAKVHELSRLTNCGNENVQVDISAASVAAWRALVHTAEYKALEEASIEIFPL